MHEPKIQLHLSELIKLYPKGHDALRQLLNHFSNQQIVLPSYRTIQDMFTNAYSMEDARLDGLISVIPQSKKEQLSVLINKEDGITPLNVIRLDQKNFKYKAITAEVDKALGHAELYEFAKKMLAFIIIRNQTKFASGNR